METEHGGLDGYESVEQPATSLSVLLPTAETEADLTTEVTQLLAEARAERRRNEACWRLMVELIADYLLAVLTVRQTSDLFMAQFLDWNQWDKEGIKLLRRLLSLLDMERIAESIKAQRIQRRLFDQFSLFEHCGNTYRLTLMGSWLFDEARKRLRRGAWKRRQRTLDGELVATLQTDLQFSRFLRMKPCDLTAERLTKARSQISEVVMRWLSLYAPSEGLMHPAVRAASQAFQDAPSVEEAAQALIGLWDKPSRALWRFQEACRIAPDLPPILEAIPGRNAVRLTECGHLFFSELR